MYFLLTFLLTISPRKSTQSVHQIAQFQSQKCKSTPLPDPPPARALRALACVFPTILQILPPTDREIFCSCPPPPPPLTTDTCYAPAVMRPLLGASTDQLWSIYLAIVFKHEQLILLSTDDRYE